MLATAPERRPARFRLPSRRLVFVLVPAAAALAVGAALVHGLVGSGGHPVRGQPEAVHGSVAASPTTGFEATAPSAAAAT